MKYLITAIGILAVFFVLVMIYDVNRFVIVTYSIRSKKIHKPYRFVLLSDLHNKQFGKENETLLKKIRLLNPDAVYMAGDMVTATPGHDMQPTLHFLEKIASEYPVYYGQGNHEYRMELYPETYGDMSEVLRNGLKKAGILPMKNSHVHVPDYGISVYGVEIEREYYQRFKTLPMDGDYLNGLLGEPKEDAYRILIAHNPDYFKDYAAWGADLVLSGHVHGGLMRLPFLGGVISPAIRLFPKYDGGLFKEGESRMILGRGLGTHTLPIRIFNPGELILVELKPEHKI